MSARQPNDPGRVHRGLNAAIQRTEAARRVWPHKCAWPVGTFERPPVLYVGAALADCILYGARAAEHYGLPRAGVYRGREWIAADLDAAVEKFRSF